MPPEGSSEAIDPTIHITGLGAISRLGSGIPAQVAGVRAGGAAFPKLGELLGPASPHAGRPGGWIEDRAALTHRKWSPVSMAALHVAREAIADARWGADELRDAALVVATSRGNAAGWLGPWPGRRPFKLMAASNTIHSEPATAISIEFGISGPNHLLASGCAAGLDAAGVAMMMLRCGLARHAVVVAVDLPLVPLLLDNYAASGILSNHPAPDPYRPGTDGFVPAEGAAAMALSAVASEGPRLVHYGCNSDACDPVGIPKNGGLPPELFAAQTVRPVAVCPHATGTAVQAVADPAALGRVFRGEKPTLHLLKPFVGHTIGASGLLESAIVCAFLREGHLPPNGRGLHAPAGFTLPEVEIPAAGPVSKVSHGMGGHNALLTIAPS